MPTLQFKDRNIIWNHNLTVPYHTLDEVKELGVNICKGRKEKIEKIVIN